MNQCRGEYVRDHFTIIWHNLDVYTYSIPSASQYFSYNDPSVANAKGCLHTLENGVEARSFMNGSDNCHIVIGLRWSYSMALTTCC